MRPAASNTNSLLNLLNPYASTSRLPHPSDPNVPDPDSPSTLLLREFQGDEELEEAIDPITSQYNDRTLSPTPTPTFRPRPTHIITSSSSSSNGEAPPESVIFGTQPRSPSPVTPPARPRSVVPPPDPYQNPGPPSSSSTSTSPGPSTLSIYASGIDLDESSREPSTSPEAAPRGSESVNVPTFRGLPRPGPPERSNSAKSRTGSGSIAESRLRVGEGYLDPKIPSPRRKGKGKGKEKAKVRVGKKYLPVPEEADEEEEDEDRGRLSGFGRSNTRVEKKVGLNEYEKALWRWVNVDDLDGFLQEVYAYYKGKGLYCIALARVLNLLTTFFVVAFSTFLLSCIDYRKLTASVEGPNAMGRLDDVLIGQCLTRGSFPHMLFILTVSLIYLFQLVNFALSLPRLLDMYRFYTYLLGVPDADMQTLPWPEIVRLIGEIRKHNPVTSLSNGQSGALADMIGEDHKDIAKKLDAHDVANRILRQENYLIALFNKDLLDLRVRLPLSPSVIPFVPPSLLSPSTTTALPTGPDPDPTSTEKRFLSFGANTLTKALEWNLRFCLMGYLFDGRGQVRKEFVRERKRKDLVEGLRRRFVFMGVLNAIFAPFIIVYLLVYSFFRYFEEYHKNPSSIGSRGYTPYAQWKFREFNELPHLFERRLDRSYPVAKEYVDQFPKERTALVMRFVAFIAGSLSAVLLAATLLDPDLFLHFEITPHRTVLFYLGIFGGVLAMARGMVPEENLVFDPEASLKEVVKWTHYLPGEWKGKLHSQMVHKEFSLLFSMKIQIFLTELLSVLLTPLILLFSLPPCAGSIIDFFREFTVHVEGVGYVCSFAVFDFRRHGATPLAVPDTPGPGDVRRNGGLGKVDWRRSNENKMEKSFLHFKATNPGWEPEVEKGGSVFLERMMGIAKGGGGGGGLISDRGATGSVYAGGTRPGMGVSGVGGGDEKERERSRSYDRAWAKSSFLMRGKGRAEESLREEEEEDAPEEDAEGGDGWNKRVKRDDVGVEEGDEGFLKDVGMMGLLQQVLAGKGG